MQVSICTSAVVGPEEICQEAYVIDKPADEPLVVCSSCAKVLRGRYQLIKSSEKLTFVCLLANERKSGKNFKILPLKP